MNVRVCIRGGGKSLGGQEDTAPIQCYKKRPLYLAKHATKATCIECLSPLFVSLLTHPMSEKKAEKKAEKKKEEIILCSSL